MATHAWVTSLNSSGSPPLSGCKRRALEQLRQWASSCETMRAPFAVCFFEVGFRGVRLDLEQIVEFPAVIVQRGKMFPAGGAHVSLTMAAGEWRKARGWLWQTRNGTGSISTERDGTSQNDRVFHSHSRAFSSHYSDLTTPKHRQRLVYLALPGAALREVNVYMESFYSIQGHKAKERVGLLSEALGEDYV